MTEEQTKRVKTGGRRAKRVFTDEELKDIYDKWVAGKRLVDLGKEYDVGFQAIHRAINKYEDGLEPEFCITRDEMKERRAKMDRARRLEAVRVAELERASAG